MTQPLVGQIARAAGLPSSVRIGTVVQADPLIVSVQGAEYNAAAVGVVEPGAPAVGQPVALLGQAGLSGGDPASWLALGSVRQGTQAASISQRGWVLTQESTTSTTYVTLATVCGTAFVAPATGRVMLHYRSFLTCGGASFTHSAPQIREGSVVNSGDLFLTAIDDNSMFQSLGSTLSFSASMLVEGLTPHADYNVVLMVRSTGGVVVIASHREVDVVPAP